MKTLDEALATRTLPPLDVVGPIERGARGERRVPVRCPCGEIRRLKFHQLQKWRACAICTPPASKHGHGSNRRGRSPTFTTWMNILQRCTNPKSPHWANYGGRGITICDRWLTFEAFLEDMGEKPLKRSIERRKNGEGYTPENCYWATAARQAHNRRSSKLTAEDVVEIRRLVLNEKRTQTAVARLFGVSIGHVNNIVRGKTWAAA